MNCRWPVENLNICSAAFNSIVNYKFINDFITLLDFIDWLSIVKHLGHLWHNTVAHALLNRAFWVWYLTEDKSDVIGQSNIFQMKYFFIQECQNDHLSFWSFAKWFWKMHKTDSSPETKCLQLILPDNKAVFSWSRFAFANSEVGFI